ncbi:MAG: hypothetical protein AUJ07_06485 [Crenarchaeota archaeon 13_1_40CM_3_53_5]|nr:MAG: hypothetical protein AUJ07_06485 [Crenarchaeota archaeon 13_1_40CM_3_53_5]
MSKRRVHVREASHATRNVLIAIFLIVLSAVGVAATGALNGFLNPQPASFPVIIHAYDAALASTPEVVTSPDQLVADATISMANATVLAGPPLSFTQTTPSGVLAPSSPIAVGTYHVGVAKDGYAPTEFLYVVGPNCDRKDSVGNCHIWIAMNKTPSP